MCIYIQSYVIVKLYDTNELIFYLIRNNPNPLTLLYLSELTLTSSHSASTEFFIKRVNENINFVTYRLALNLLKLFVIRFQIHK